SGTVAGSRSISADPVLVSPANSDFRLGSQATGQAFDSPAIDRGSSTANALGLSGRTAFTDKFPDEGPVDLGYHGTVLKQAEGSVTVSQASLILSGNNEGFTISANLQPGTGSDGIEAGTEYVEVEFGGVKSLLRAGGFSGGPPHWTYSGGDVSGTIDKQPNGSVDVTVQANGLALEPKISTSTRIAVRVGDDYGATLIPFRGTLRFP
ncbi:MAG: hypothetical protein HYZ72_00110, partial [Deltaproteobacteria bacterium]|nr:hypothetical protein [Deltaproteobacteria bacterium]